MRGAVEAHGQRGAADLADLVLRGEAPLRRHAGGPFAQDLLVVQLAEFLGRVQDAEAHVGGAVADAEHPAVAGQQLAVAAGKFQPAFHPVVVVPRAGEVGADGDAERPVVALPDAERDGGAGRVAVRCEHDVGGEVPGLAGLAPGRRPAARRGPRSTRPSSSERSASVTLCRSSTTAPADRACRASSSSKPSRVRISPYCGKSETSGQGSSMLRPPASRRRPLLRRQPSASGCGRPSFWISRTARGVSPSPQTFSRGKAGLFQHRDVDACLGQVVGGGGPGRTGSDDQYFHGGDGLARGPGELRRSFATGPVWAASAAAPAAGPASAPGLTARCTATMPPLRLR